MSKIGIGLVGLLAVICASANAQECCWTSETLTTESPVVFMEPSYPVCVVWESNPIYHNPVVLDGMVFANEEPVFYGSTLENTVVEYPMAIEWETPVVWATPVFNFWIDECGCIHEAAMGLGNYKAVTDETTYTSTNEPVVVMNDTVAGVIENTVQRPIYEEAVATDEADESTEPADLDEVSDSDEQDESGYDEIDN